MYCISELGSHIDTTVVGSSFFILTYNVRECGVFTYHVKYEYFKGTPMLHATTYCKSPETGLTYILVMYETLCKGDTLHHTFFNINQIHRYVTGVHYNQVSENLLSVIKIWLFYNAVLN